MKIRFFYQTNTKLISLEKDHQEARRLLDKLDVYQKEKNKAFQKLDKDLSEEIVEILTLKNTLMMIPFSIILYMMTWMILVQIMPSPLTKYSRREKIDAFLTSRHRLEQSCFIQGLLIWQLLEEEVKRKEQYIPLSRKDTSLFQSMMSPMSLVVKSHLLLRGASLPLQKINLYLVTFFFNLVS